MKTANAVKYELIVRGNVNVTPSPPNHGVGEDTRRRRFRWCNIGPAPPTPGCGDNSYGLAPMLFPVPGEPSVRGSRERFAPGLLGRVFWVVDRV